jgi:DNA repair protein RecO (recombination protein O)
MIKKCEAIVLRSIDYRDQSKILTLYTKEFGRMSAIAKGCRSPQSKYASAFEVGSHINVVLYKKSTREVQNISDASVKTAFLGITASLEKLSAMHQIVELIRLATEDEETQPKIFALLAETLWRVDQSKRNIGNFFFYFQVKLVTLLGFKPSFEECVLSGKNIWKELESADEKLLALLPEHGGIALRREAESRGLSGRAISIQAVRLIQLLASSAMDDLENLRLQDGVAGEIAQILDTYFRFHIEDLPPLRSREVFNQLTQ